MLLFGKIMYFAKQKHEAKVMRNFSVDSHFYFV